MFVCTVIEVDFVDFRLEKRKLKNMKWGNWIGG